MKFVSDYTFAIPDLSKLRVLFSQKDISFVNKTAEIVLEWLQLGCSIWNVIDNIVISWCGKIDKNESKWKSGLSHVFSVSALSGPFQMPRISDSTDVDKNSR